MIDVDAKNLPLQQRQVLGVAGWVGLRARVAHADVQIPIRPEIERAARMIVGDRMDDDRFLQRLTRIGDQIVLRRALQDLGLEAFPLRRVVHDVILVVLLELRVEDHAGQPVGALHDVADVAELRSWSLPWRSCGRARSCRFRVPAPRKRHPRRGCCRTTPDA